jgi:uridine kinase
LIGIAGGTASGKSTLVDRIQEAVAPIEVAILRQDWYYRDQSHLAMEARVQTNYDHPDSFDNDLLHDHVDRLLRGEAVEAPTYDFANHNRATVTMAVKPHKVVLVEGIMVLHDRPLRDRMDIKLFVDADPDVRILRRLERDIVERKRTFESVMERYLKDVRPMHLKYVEPSKFHADLIIPSGAFNSVVVEILSTLINNRYRTAAPAAAGPQGRL